MSLTLTENCVTSIPVAICHLRGGKFATGINKSSGTGGKFTAAVVDPDGAPCLANISANFEKFRNDPNVEHEKNTKQNTAPLTLLKPLKAENDQCHMVDFFSRL